MKLDADCVRDVLISIEVLQHVFVNDDGYVEKEALWAENLYDALPEYDRAVVFYALYNLDQAGYISLSVKWINGCVDECAINHITYAGHELTAKIRDKERWHGIKKALPVIRNYSIDAIGAVSEGMTSAAITALIQTGR